MVYEIWTLDKSNRSVLYNQKSEALKLLSPFEVVSRGKVAVFLVCGVHLSRTTAEYLSLPFTQK
ncbi:hypothetical protein D3C85_1377620 [compost metagenome]